MAKKVVTIRISAETGCGKSTLSYAIKDLLENAGIKTDVNDIDVQSLDEVEILERLEGLSENIVVHIEQVQLRRGAGATAEE